MYLDARKFDFVACEQQRRRLAPLLFTYCKIIPKLALFKISTFHLISIAEQIGLSLPQSVPGRQVFSQLGPYDVTEKLSKL